MVTWNTIAESPAVLAVEDALEMLNVFSSVPNPLDIRVFIAGLTMPLGNLRAELERQGMPSGEFLGESFERKVYTGRYGYFSNRNRASGLNSLARDAQFTYLVNSWTLDALGKRVGIELCVTPSPLVPSNNAWLTFVREWVEWLLPHFKGAVSVVLCVAADINLTLQVGGSALIQWIVEAS